MFKLQDMTGGWMVGDFEPVCLPLEACEVACKRYKAGDAEGRHVHRVATELTLIAFGRVLINGTEYASDDIIVLEPGESADFKALEDSITVVVKIPSVIGDKYSA